MMIEKQNMIGIAQRENNKKRNYLFVNRYQAKHIPVSPQKAITLFEELAEKVYQHCKHKKTTIIGFAETATAIGSVVAMRFGGSAYYIHTSREKLPQEYNVLDFREEHSHATEQILYCKDSKRMLLEAEQILFVEDELTTGKTILNFIEELKRKGIKADFVACSIVNSMEQQHKAVFAQKNIALYSLFDWNETVTDKLFFNDEIVLEREVKELPDVVNHVTLEGKIDVRLGSFVKEYQKACQYLAEQICEMISHKNIESILILGTEEYMYPAVFAGSCIEKRGLCRTVKTHSTTRSPIVARIQQQYPIVNRSSFESLYEKGRKTYLYNLEKYDSVIIVTDAEEYNQIGEQQLLQALKCYGNNDVTIIRWRNI